MSGRTDGLKEIKFVINGEPASKGRPRFSRHGGVYTPKDTRQAQQAMAWEIKKAMGSRMPLRGDVAVMANLFVSDWERDADNMLKLVLDAANRIAYDDDRQVALIVCRKLRSTAPRIEVCIFGLDEEGE